jgi:hypothetical protein
VCSQSFSLTPARGKLSWIVSPRTTPLTRFSPSRLFAVHLVAAFAMFAWQTQIHGDLLWLSFVLTFLTMPFALAVFDPHLLWVMLTSSFEAVYIVVVTCISSGLAAFALHRINGWTAWEVVLQAVVSIVFGTLFICSDAAHSLPIRVRTVVYAGFMVACFFSWLDLVFSDNMRGWWELELCDTAATQYCRAVGSIVSSCYVTLGFFWASFAYRTCKHPGRMVVLTAPLRLSKGQLTEPENTEKAEANLGQALALVSK